MSESRPINSKCMRGYVLGTNIGDWAGFKAGTIILEADSGKRLSFHYGRESHGMIPAVGDFVEITFKEGNLAKVIKINSLGDPSPSFNSQRRMQPSGILVIANRPTLGVGLVFIEVVASVWTLLIGLNLSGSKPAAIWVFGAVAVAHFAIAVILWDYLDRS